MSAGRKISAAVVMYGAAIVALVFCAGIGLMIIASASLAPSQKAEAEKTILDQRIESAREVRAALARGVPKPEPLAPITAKLARDMKSVQTDMKSVQTAATIKPPKLSAQARNAFASANKDFSASTNSRSYVSFDRHSTSGF